MFWAGVAAGVGIGLSLGLVLGHLLMSTGLGTIQATIEKVTYSLRYPKAPTTPVQVVLPTEEQYKSLEEDEERVPNWMEDDYVMER